MSIKKVYRYTFFYAGLVYEYTIFRNDYGTKKVVLFSEKCIIYTMYRKIEQYIRNHLITVAILYPIQKTMNKKLIPHTKKLCISSLPER